MKKYRNVVGLGVVGLVMCGAALHAQEFGRYREFVLGSSVATVTMTTATTPSELKSLHRRPALIQELTWRPRYAVRRQPGPDNESVEQMVFSFYEDQLYRVAVEYDRERTAGLSDTDMIEAVSSIYGSAVRPVASRSQAPSPARDDLGVSLGQWGNVDIGIALYRVSSFATRYRLIVTGERVATLARTATAQALVLDAREAPQRAAAQARKEAEDRRVADEKSRSANKTSFRP